MSWIQTHMLTIKMQQCYLNLGSAQTYMPCEFSCRVTHFLINGGTSLHVCVWLIKQYYYIGQVNRVGLLAGYAYSWHYWSSILLVVLCTLGDSVLQGYTLTMQLSQARLDVRNWAETTSASAST